MKASHPTLNRILGSQPFSKEMAIQTLRKLDSLDLELELYDFIHEILMDLCLFHTRLDEPEYDVSWVFEVGQRHPNVKELINFEFNEVMWYIDAADVEKILKELAESDPPIPEIKSLYKQNIKQEKRKKLTEGS